MIYCMGEALIDFVPVAGEGAPQFAMHAGGAPANVAAAVAKLGGQAAFIGKIGADPFGDFIAQTLAALGVDVSLLLRAHCRRPATCCISAPSASRPPPHGKRTARRCAPRAAPGR